MRDIPASQAQNNNDEDDGNHFKGQQRRRNTQRERYSGGVGSMIRVDDDGDTEEQARCGKREDGRTEPRLIIDPPIYWTHRHSSAAHRAIRLRTRSVAGLVGSVQRGRLIGKRVACTEGLLSGRRGHGEHGHSSATRLTGRRLRHHGAATAITHLHVIQVRKVVLQEEHGRGRENALATIPRRTIHIIF